MKRLTTEDFIKKAILKHGNTYDYSLVEYKSMHSKVRIICKEHNVFEQSPINHINNQGCPQCGINKKSLSQSKNIDYFLEKAKLKHGYKYDYSLVEYKTAITKVKIICQHHGVFEQEPIVHYRSGCIYCGRTISSIKGNKTAEKNILKPIEYFINKSNFTHKNKYDYSLVEYKSSNEKVKIICPEHGIFEQQPRSHVRGHGCVKCANFNSHKHNSTMPKGWSVNSWQKSANKSKNFDSFKVYIIRCWNDKENFYKIGRTYRKVENRFKNIFMPYNYEIIKEIIFDKHTEMVDNAKDCFDKESELKRINKNYKYVPKTPFRGRHECFSKIDSKLLL